MDKKHLAELILIQMESLSQVDSENSPAASLTLLNEVLRNAKALAEDVYEEESGSKAA